MKKHTLLKKLLSSILVTIIVLGQFSGYQLISEAGVVTSENGTLSLSLSKTNENGNGYAFGMEPDGSLGENIWSLVSSDGTHGANLYCIKAQYGETWNNTGTPSDLVVYNQSYTLPLTEETLWTTADTILLGEHKNEILWLIDNLYIPGESDKEDYIKYLNDAGITENNSYYTYASKPGHNYTFISSATDSYNKTVTEEDIVAIQQMALWYYTNYGANGNVYNELLGTSPWLQYTTNELLETSTQYKDLENLSKGRAIHATIIYNYLVNEAKNVADSLGENEEYKLRKKIAKLWVSTNNGTVNEEQPVIEVHKIEEKPFDLSLRKAIFKVEYKDGEGNYQIKEIKGINGESAIRNLKEDGSIGIIDTDSLVNPGTTASYKHRKNSVVVEPGDKVTYSITIYNEGEEAGYANKIIDQLPGTWGNGLRLENNQTIVTSTTGNTYGVNYITSTNTVEFTMLDNSPKNVIAPYDAENGQLSYETILIECVVMAEPDTKVLKELTNIAFIAEEYNAYFDTIITNQTVQDRDSKTWEYPQSNSLMTTPENGYKGNANNPTDLSDKNTYYAGIQDDDDFEKIVILPENDITVEKIWNDSNNQDGLRPTSIQIQLYANGVATGEIITLTAGEDEIWQENELKYTWEKLPMYKEGSSITYTVKEISSNGTPVENNGAYDENYTTTYNDDTLTITNSYNPETTQVIVEKVWNDNNNQYGIRPNSIKVQLYANGEKHGDSIQLNSENAWKHTWENLARKENGQNIEYTVKEINDKDEVVEDKQKYNVNYVTTYSKNANLTTITNTQLTFDLKLIKFVTEINDEKTENRIIKVDTSKLNTIDTESGKIITTAEYILEKNPVSVKAGDFITYTLRVYNEGNYDGYVTEISENIPEGLEFIVITDGAIFSWDGTEQKDITEEIKASAMYEKIVEINSNWGYKQDSTVITTKALTEDLIKGFGKENVEYADEDNKIDYKEVQVIFRVKNDVAAKKLIRNEAAITADKAVDNNGEEIEILDRDSKPEEWNKENSDKTYDEEGKWPIYKEDDEDYDNIITKAFDLSLRKQIIQINNALYTQRFAKLDSDNNYSNTLYDYYDVYRNKVKVKAGDLVTYSIRVYNEGEIDGYASLIVDTLPSGLEFYSSEYKGIDYKWTLVEGTENVYQTDYLSYEKDANKETENSTIIKAYDGEGEANYKEIFIVCKVKEDVTKEDKLLNVAQIAEDSDENGKTIKDKDSIPGNSDDENKWKEEDDLDIETLQLQEFDLALRKFITQIENGEKIEEITSRIPQVSYDKETKQIKYTHTKDALVVHVGDTVIYTLRVYNEGDIDGYASEIKDNIPEYLEYLPEHSTNKEYEWVMYDKEGNKTEDVTKAVFITTEYLAKGNGAEKETEKANLLKAFNPESELSNQNPDYKEVKVAFKVKDPNSTEYEIVNFAQISEDTDSRGETINDKDSTPDNGKEEPKEDDEDIEKVKVEYFDLSLLKYVTKVLVNENGEERIIETGNIGDENDIIPHVQINKKNINKTVVKFVYSIKITNEGQIAGEATEITDYVPEGLVFVAEDNEHWKDEGNNIISTRQLTGSTLQPGESAEVEVVLRWINGEENLGAKTNIAEISEDYNEKDVPDKDSIPDNQKDDEDDIDDATVLLSINQGGGIPSIYMNTILICLTIMMIGGILIKKFVL